MNIEIALEPMRITGRTCQSLAKARFFSQKLAEREKDSGGVSAATRIERGNTNRGKSFLPPEETTRTR
ncbi:MAG: hypothetical protein HRF42_10975 [Candidatus Brocadia sp.]